MEILGCGFCDIFFHDYVSRQQIKYVIMDINAGNLLYFLNSQQIMFGYH